ncbi:LacI family DNA-binding transcriptional regulator [Nonomuraea sp. NBC_00507]|uniref:LacI family DNA-binding transcriptional regulator n=1 Tax=Nonomuraea sp. NBC_00507 TaxID=2976002 RepID=UPI002E198BEF
MTRRPSIRDVAREAGVSITTVSRALNDVVGSRLPDDTRRRVRETAERLGYAPNKMARGLRTQRSHMLGMISDHIATTPHAGRLILGAQEVAMTRGWALMLINTGGDPAAEARGIQALHQQQVDGVLYATMYHRIVTVPSELRGLPLVMADARTEGDGPPAVVPDEVRGGYDATRELLDHGHRRVGLALNSDDVPATHGRLRGYRQALEEAGIAYDPELVVQKESETTGGYLACRRLLERTPRPTAIFCYNDRMAMGAYRAAAELGLRIPEDVSVVGFDNQEYIADGLYPGLTTLQLPHYEMGAWAVDRLMELIDDPARNAGDVPDRTLPCPLIRRSSVAAPSA